MGIGINLIKAGTPSHTFMPTATTLDMHQSNLLLNIKDAYLADQTISPFDCYWAPQRTDKGDKNMLHVQFSRSQNHPWIQEQICADWQLRNAQGEYNGVLTAYYNYGRPWEYENIIKTNKPYQTILYSLEIENNGRLYVNKQDKIGLSTGTLLPRPGNTFKLKTNYEPCDSTVVKIKYGGKFIVGDINNGIINKGEVRFCKNSRLEIFNKGQLIIKDSSRLVIEEGASLVIHQGAQILLDGPNAVLEIRGKIVIDDNSTLEPAGEGFIRFAAIMDANNYPDFWDAGSNSALVLNSPGSTTIKKAEVVENVTFPDSLNIRIANAILVIDSMKTLNAYGSIQAQNSVFTAMDTTKIYDLFGIYGQANTRFGNCTFSYGNFGLKAEMSFGGNGFTLDTCTFTHNHIGLYTDDQHISLNHCKLNQNSDYGWKAFYMQSNCNVTACEFNQNVHGGIYFHSQLNVVLNIRNSQINDNQNDGLEIEWGTLQASCNEIKRNTRAGIYANDKSSIDLSGNSKNSIMYNQYGILFNKAFSLHLENGFNNFTGNQYYLLGEMLPDNYYVPNANPNAIAIDNNLMPATSNNSLAINMYYYDMQNIAFYQIPLAGWTQGVSSISCVCAGGPVPANYDNYKTYLGKISVHPINTPHFPNTYLIDALKTAAMQMSFGDTYLGNDTFAIALFKEIFDTIPSSINDDEQWAVDQGLSQMLTALSRAIEQELIDPNRAMDGMPVDEYVAMIGEEIQNRLNDVNYANAYAAEQEAYYHLLMAQMYRAAEHYDYALSILQNPNYFANTSLSSQADYWSCICNAENQLIKGNIERSQYELQIDSCHQMNTARRAMFIPIFGTTKVTQNSKENQILGVYPNPAGQLIAVEFTLSVKEVSVELSDLSGRLIWQSTKTVNGKQLRLSLPKVSRGAYMLKTTTENQVFNNKIIIR